VAIELGQPAPQEAARPPRRADGRREVDERLRLALPLLLHSRHEGQGNAATWEQLREELRVEGLEVGAVRRLQECAEALLEDEGHPIVGLSSSGVWWAQTASEIELALDECERRARKTLRRRRLLRRVWLAMKGQEELPPPVADGGRAA
jgi:hypothetical protein